MSEFNLKQINLWLKAQNARYLGIPGVLEGLSIPEVQGHRGNLQLQLAPERQVVQGHQQIL